MPVQYGCVLAFQATTRAAATVVTVPPLPMTLIVCVKGLVPTMIA
jgi:hypothetical protein